jgi:serine/threonine protein kinase
MSDADGVAANTGDPQLSATRNGGNGPSDPDATLLLSASEPFRAAEHVSEPKSIGPYQLIRKLGEGGMGQVWLGEQTAPIKRRVALKLIKVGLYDDSVLHRFYAERQSLAMMDHPSIAKVFDAGATPDGRSIAATAYLLQRMNARDGEWVSCRRIPPGLSCWDDVIPIVLSSRIGWNLRG